MKSTPRSYQLSTYENTKDKEYYGYLWEQGLGKTKITIDVAFYLSSKDKINSVLILAPNGVHLNWLYEEMPKHAWFDVPSAAWQSTPRAAQKRAIEALLEGEGLGFRWFFMNIEAIRTSRGFKAAHNFIRSSNCLLVVDESTVIKNPKAQQTRSALKLGSIAKYRRILTGTPISQGPLDVFSQIKFLHPNAIPITSYTAFKRTFAVEEVMSMGNRSFSKVVGYRNLEYLKTLLKPFTIRLKKEECEDLPEKIYSTYYVEMTKDQEKLYQSIKETQVGLLKQEEELTGMVSVTSVLSALAKLKQVCCGFVIDDDGKIHDVPNNRFQALGILTEDQSEKYVIWTTFRHSVETIQRFLADRNGDNSVVSYYGKTPQHDRSAIVRAFNRDKHVRFFVANRAASKGLTLTAASRSIFFANSESLEDRLQSEDRIHRIGQTRTCFYTDLTIRGTAEEQTLKRLKMKEKLSNKVITSDWKEILNES